MPKENLKKYSPAAILAAFLVSVVYELAYHFNWWKLKNVLFSWARISDYTFILGPFLVGTVWIFHLTYRIGFVTYTCANLLLDAFFSFKFLPFLEKLGVIKLKNISHLGIYGLMLLVSLIIYPYQKWIDSGMVKSLVRNRRSRCAAD
ncbi:hypothetical protein [Neobacillus endophyticus]|uniref:hypothetical protein n=1 Tax=Neobacillus endophyticus TaxID=2738405 RepID=UPI001C258DFE|nr:hypothetical protein [Neobacillus endophyticus]